MDRPQGSLSCVERTAVINEIQDLSEEVDRMNASTEASLGDCAELRSSFDQMRSSCAQMRSSCAQIRLSQSQMARDLSEEKKQMTRDLSEEKKQMTRDLSELRGQMTRDLSEEKKQMTRDFSELRAAVERNGEMQKRIKKNSERTDEILEIRETELDELIEESDRQRIASDRLDARLDVLEFPYRHFPETPQTSNEELSEPEEMEPRLERRGRCWFIEWVCNIWESIKECFSSMWN
ncbi:hypothetical protein KY331_01425 [Candidatus Woesearchaeota archaeon]|nr:hypothetical protein [Candidatus Woesearchaeota archaeon]